MTPIRKGTAERLGLRKPTGVYRYRDGSNLKWLESWRACRPARERPFSPLSCSVA